MPSDLILELRDIVKTFSGVRALDGAKFDLRPGEVHALVGENGAGKSTLMNVIAGVHRPDSGQILLAGRPVSFTSPHHAAQHGIGVVFQELSLVPNLSVAENVFAHRQPVWALNLIDWRTLHEQTQQLLSLFDLDVSPTTLVRDLSMAQRQVVEILKALSHRSRAVILDEPTSSLTAVETDLLFAHIRRLRQEGVAFIYISHHLAEIFRVADRVTVMRDGKYVETFAINAVDEEMLVRRMVGRELLNVYGRRSVPIGQPCFEVRGASRSNHFHNVNFTLRRGEILGIAGLVGAGRTDLGRALCGIEPLDSGDLMLDGVRLRVQSPQQAIRGGLGYMTEDRKDQGLFLRMSIRDNCAAPSLSAFTGRLGWIDDGRIDEFAEACRDRFNIVASHTQQRAGNLSGGNQQKVLLSMWMGIGPQVLIVDEPTRGVDIGAKSDIYALLRELAGAGVGIIMISSDLQEILGVSDRVLVMRDGCMVAEFTGARATEENIIAAATGVELRGT
ncbi:MAG: sugar ABC transporter ATP-binding protein [Tepidisphaeraceae bacterium]|jgi:ABC-type sugar transport system ATPase subunit